MKLSTRARYGLKALIDLGLHSANEAISLQLCGFLGSTDSERVTDLRSDTDSFSEYSVEYAGESGVQVQKRTDIRHGMDIDSGYLTVKQKISKKFSKKQKKNQAGSA